MVGFALPPPRIAKWTRRATETAADYGVFRVDRLKMLDSAGKPRRDFFTFACSEWSNVVALTDAGELVLIWQYRFGTDALSLEIPGGVVDPGESPLEAARRELLEETGYEARDLTPHCSVEANPALQNNRCYTFLARGVRRVAAPAFDANEECELVLVPAEHIPALLDDNHVTHALVRVALETYLRKGGTREAVVLARAEAEAGP